MRTVNRSPIGTIVAAVLVVAAGACSNDSDADPTTTTGSATTDSAVEATTNTPTTTAASTSSTSTSTTSTTTTLLTVTSVSAPPSTGGPVDNEDWVATIQALLDTRDVLNAAPDPTRAGEVYFAGSQPWVNFENQLANKQRDGLRDVDFDPTRVLSAELTFHSPPDGGAIESVLVTTTQHVGPNFGRIVDSDGNTVFELVPEPAPPDDGVITVQYGLVRLEGGPWLIATQDGL